MKGATRVLLGVKGLTLIELLDTFTPFYGLLLPLFRFLSFQDAFYFSHFDPPMSPSFLHSLHMLEQSYYLLIYLFCLFSLAHIRIFSYPILFKRTSPSLSFISGTSFQTHSFFVFLISSIPRLLPRKFVHPPIGKSFSSILVHILSLF